MTTDRSRSVATRLHAKLGRRQLLAGVSGLAPGLLAGCAANEPGIGADDAGDSVEDDGTDPDSLGEGSDDGAAETDDGSADSTEQTASRAPFRLLISDRPADIEDFDRLDVTLDRARIFPAADEDAGDGSSTSDGSGDEPEDEESEGGDEDGDTGTDGEDGEADDADGDDPDPASDDGDQEPANDGGSRGFYTLDLADAEPVDLTEVVGDKAVAVFDGELDEGRYTKIELHVAAVEGIVDGDEAEVKVPSEKLQITHPFELRADDPLDFVFDINVVQRGRDKRYNLTPVISESGVAGEDVEVEEVQPEDDAESEGADENGDDAEPEASDDAAGSDGAADENPAA